MAAMGRLVLSLSVPLNLEEIFFCAIVHRREILAIYVKAERYIKNNAILADFVGNSGCRGEFDFGQKSVIDCFVL